MGEAPGRPCMEMYAALRMACVASGHHPDARARGTVDHLLYKYYIRVSQMLCYRLVTEMRFSFQIA